MITKYRTWFCLLLGAAFFQPGCKRVVLHLDSETRCGLTDLTLATCGETEGLCFVWSSRRGSFAAGRACGPELANTYIWSPGKEAGSAVPDIVTVEARTGAQGEVLATTQLTIEPGRCPSPQNPCNRKHRQLFQFSDTPDNPHNRNLVLMGRVGLATQPQLQEPPTSLACDGNTVEVWPFAVIDGHRWSNLIAGHETIARFTAYDSANGYRWEARVQGERQVALVVVTRGGRLRPPVGSDVEGKLKELLCRPTGGAYRGTIVAAMARFSDGTSWSDFCSGEAPTVLPAPLAHLKMEGQRQPLMGWGPKSHRIAVFLRFQGREAGQLHQAFWVVKPYLDSRSTTIAASETSPGRSEWWVNVLTGEMDETMTAYLAFLLPPAGESDAKDLGIPQVSWVSDEAFASDVIPDLCKTALDVIYWPVTR